MGSKEKQKGIETKTRAGLREKVINRTSGNNEAAA
jgi:hypothetical protein